MIFEYFYLVFEGTTKENEIIKLREGILKIYGRYEKRMMSEVKFIQIIELIEIKEIYRRNLNCGPYKVFGAVDNIYWC